MLIQYTYIFERKKNKIKFIYRIKSTFSSSIQLGICFAYVQMFFLGYFIYIFLQSKTHENTEQTDGIFIWIKCSIAAKIICCRIIMLCVSVCFVFLLSFLLFYFDFNLQNGFDSILSQPTLTHIVFILSCTCER